MTEATTLAFLGDLMLGRKISRALHHHPPEWFWGDALPVLRGADAVFANLECPIAQGPLARNAWKTFHFRADPAAVEILKCGNVRFVCLANNHTLDYGAAGLSQTLSILDAAGIGHAGAGMNRLEAEEPATIRLRGLTVGIIAATDNVRVFGAGSDHPGTNFITTIRGRSRAREWIARSSEALRQAGADLVVLALHWGPNMRTAPPSWFRRFAHAAIESGVDIVHGHSAHVFQAVERHRDGAILYDTGNFIDDYWKFPFRHTFWSFIFLVEVGADRRWRLRLLPVNVHTSSHASPLSLATGDSFQAIREHMRRLCRAFDTPIIDTPEGLEIPGGVLRSKPVTPNVAQAQSQ
jgi:poly-gamma-glutamate capsule biosynthesis protein CapA/YwtB (metallophosphatase superfamily)